MTSYGALVGWTHQDLGENLMVKVETVRSKSDADKHTPDTTHILMTRQQAVILGNYLLTTSGTERRRSGKPGFLRRLFA